jgi:outer membrane protein assembly factor BamB
MITRTRTAYKGNLQRTGEFQARGVPSFSGTRWQFAAEENIQATPLVTDEGVYVGCANGLFYALDVRTGQERWRFQADSAIPTSAESADDTIYFGSQQGFLYALDALTGQLIWKRSIWNWQGERDDEQAIEDEEDVSWVHFPTVIDQHLYCSTHLGVLIIERKTQRIVWAEWEDEVEDGNFTPSYIGYVGAREFAINENLLYTTDYLEGKTYRGGVSAQNLAGDELVWSEDCDSLKATIFPDGFIIAHGNIYLQTGEEIVALDAQTGEMEWSYQPDEGQFCGVDILAASPELLYCSCAFDNQAGLVALDPINQETAWTFLVPSSNPDPGSPHQNPGTVSGLSLAHDLLYVSTEVGTLYVLDGRTGKQYWHFQAKSKAIVSPCTISDDALYFSASNVLYALE